MDQLGKHFYDFGPFRVDPSERLLLRGYEVVPPTPKAFEMLLVLVESGGHVLTKDELMKRVWPDTIVEEANLSHNVYKLREALGEGHNGEKYIETVPRRGYRFVAKVREVRDEEVDLIVAEHTRARVIIEEETNASDEPVMMNVADERPQTSPTVRALAVNQIARPARRGRLAVALVITGLVIGGGATLFVLYSSFKSGKPVKAERTMTITRVTNSGRAATATISPDGKLIAYSQNYNPGNSPTAGKGSLYVQQTGSNHAVQLLEPGERTFGNTAFSPDGTYIYYIVYEKREPQGMLYRIPALGGPPTRVLADITSMFSLSPDGTRVAFYRNDLTHKQLKLVIAMLNGSSEQTLLTRPFNQLLLTGIAAWSPNGKMIAFVPDTSLTKPGDNGEAETIYTIDIASGAMKALTDRRWAVVGNIIWMPDANGLVFIAYHAGVGNQLYYVSYPEGEVRPITSGPQTYGNYGLGVTADGSTLAVDSWESTTQLWIMGTDGDTSRATRLTGGGYDGRRGIAALPDGRISYVANEGGHYDFWTVRDDGTEAKPVTADSFLDQEIAATSDGRYFIFTSDRAGGSQIFRADADGSQFQQLTFSDAHNDMPDCSPDGKWVAYNSSPNGKTTVWKVSMDGGRPAELTNYECVAPAFSPDGKFISCIIPSEGPFQKGSIAVIDAEGGSPLKSYNVIPFSWSYLSAHWTPDGQSLTFRGSEGDVTNLWKQPLAGGPPTPLTDFKTDIIFNYAFSRDGRHLILSRGQTVLNVVLIKNFR